MYEGIIVNEKVIAQSSYSYMQKLEICIMLKWCWAESQGAGGVSAASSLVHWGRLSTALSKIISGSPSGIFNGFLNLGQFQNFRKYYQICDAFLVKTAGTKCKGQKSLFQKTKFRN